MTPLDRANFSVAPSRAKAPLVPAKARLGWGIAALLVATHGAAVGFQLADDLHLTVTCVLIEGLIYAASAWLITSGRMTLGVAAILTTAALLRISILPLAPYHSTDIYRYIWDGRVQAAGVNPYLYIPVDTALSALRDMAIWPNINRADYAHTIYPPAAEALFFLATRISETVVWMKTVLVLFEAGAIVVLLRLLDAEKLPRQRILLYAWCPLPIWEFAGNGHVDAAMMACVLVAVLLRRRGADVSAGAALGLAILVKLFPLVLLPAFWRRWEWRLPLAGAVTIALFYGFYSAAGWRVVGFLPSYLGEEGGSDAHGFWLVSVLARTTGLVIPAPIYFAAAAVAMIGLALMIQAEPPSHDRILPNVLALATAAMFLLSPVYPWYFCWLTPFLCFAPSAPVIWFAGCAFVLHWTLPREAAWTTDVFYGGGIVTAAIDFARRLYVREPIGGLA
jgi:hypothetical protein